MSSDGKQQQQQSTMVKEITVAVVYGLISISITFFNKAVLSVYNFKDANTLTLVQMLFSSVFLIVLRMLNMIPSTPLSWKHAQQCFPLAVCFASMAVTGLSALGYVNVPMFSALRRATTLIVLVGEYIILGKVVATDETWSVVMMVGGALIAGAGDLSWSFMGYLLIGLNCLVTAGYLVYIKRTSQDTRLDSLTLMLYNNLLSIPVVLVVVFMTEWDSIVNYPLWWDPGFLACFLMSAIQAFLLNWFIFLCSTINSPLTTSVTGQIKSIVTTVLGLFMFGDVELTTLLSIGLILSSVASIWYAKIKHDQKLAADAAKAQRPQV